MKTRFGPATIDYQGLMLPFIAGKTPMEREKAFFVIFSTMVGAIKLARMVPDAARQRALATARDFPLGSF